MNYKISFSEMNRLGQPDKLKKVQTFLRANAGTGITVEKRQYLKSEEAAALVVFAQTEK